MGYLYFFVKILNSVAVLKLNTSTLEALPDLNSSDYG